jgi:hypothetical protein
VNDLYDRAARVLGWKHTDTHTVSMLALRDLVRPVDPDLAHEMTLAIQSGAYLKGTAAPAAPARGPTKKVAKDLESAVRAAQLYIGRVHTIAKRRNKRRNMAETDAYEQITGEAKRRGGLQPLPGKDI